MSAAADVAIFVPAYNAAAHLRQLIARIPATLWPRIAVLWVIDDGSTDATPSVVSDIAAQGLPVRLHSFATNRGYGAVVKQGIALCDHSDAAFTVCLHGDGQYPPELLEQMLAVMKERGLDVLQGSRHARNTALQGGMPLYKYVAGRLLTRIENRVFGLRLTDYHSGYLCYSRKLLDTVDVQPLSGSFTIDLEIIAAARRAALAIGEYPIPTRYADEISYLNPLGYGLRVLGVMARYLGGGYRSCF
jgi:glycosyltransferase involved in cell wall biosynthesis